MTLSTAERDRRHSAIRTAMAEEGIGTLVVVGRDGYFARGNVRYVSSYGICALDQYCVVPLDGPPCLIIWRGHTPTVRRHCWIEEIYDTLDARTTLLEQVRARDEGSLVGLVGLNDIPVPIYLALSELLGARLVDATPLLRRLRTVKSEEEIQMIESAAHVGTSALLAIKDMVQPGVTDFEIYGELKRVIHASGCEYSMEFVDAFGSEISVFNPVGEELVEGGNFTVEITPAYEGYYAQLVSTLPVGRPTSRAEEMNKIWREAMLAGRAAARPGNRARDVHQAIAQPIHEAGFEMPSRCGHALGLDVNDGFGLVADEETELVPGMTLVIHPNLVDPATDEGVMYGSMHVVTEAGVRELHDFPIEGLRPALS